MSVFSRPANVLRYIIRHNPWYMVPWRTLRSLGVLLFQYTTGSVVSIRLFNGKRMILFPKNPVSALFLYTDIPDKKEIQFLRSHTDSHTIFLDVGAHIGSYSICLMDKIMYSIAFEPSPVIAKWCRMNFLLNGADGQYVRQIALSNKNGNVHFTVDKGQTENRITSLKTKSIEVLSTTLDAFVKKEKLSKKNSYLMKIDVEGGEVEVVKGAVGFLMSYPISGIVYESFGEKAAWMKKNLEKKGFKVRLLSEHNYSAVRN